MCFGVFNQMKVSSAEVMNRDKLIIMETNNFSFDGHWMVHMAIV